MPDPSDTPPDRWFSHLVFRLQFLGASVESAVIASRQATATVGLQLLEDADATPGKDLVLLDILQISVELKDTLEASKLVLHLSGRRWVTLLHGRL